MEIDFLNFDNSTTYFAEIILPVSVGNSFTYRIPNSFLEEMITGKRALVPFGKNKVYAGIILSVHNKVPSGYEAKYILSILDSEPIILESHLNFWKWISEYYVCHLGEVMKAALPSGLKLESESYLVLNEDFEIQNESLNVRENQILDILKLRGEIKLAELSQLISLKSVFPLVKSLLSKNIVLLREEMSKGYSPQKKAFVRLASEYDKPQIRKNLFLELDKKPAQLSLLMNYLDLIGKTRKEVPKSILLEAASLSPSVLNLLVKKGVFELYHKRVSRLETFSEPETEIEVLSEIQQSVYADIKKEFLNLKVVLLHGVTSSGKTLIYFKLIEDYLRKNQQVLYLLPEIALTSQLVRRMRKKFGNKVGIYHSNFNENERVETWEKILNGYYSIVIGARSALFLPFQNLGFIIVDEEHEPSFKQYDPAPRYHARDSAIYLGLMQNAKVLLGSATPSVESYYHAKSGKYGLVSLNERYGGVKMPQIQLVDLSIENREKKLKFHFSSLLLQELDKTISENEQVILFQNRRGYSPLLLCKSCGFIPKCIHCEVSLTYHKSTQKLHCHYCGYKIDTPKECPVCHEPEIQDQGLGTEKIEEELQSLYPKLRIGRMDLDTTRGKNGHWKILSELEDHAIDVLVGTQMVSKGLDFGKVQLIGVMNADQILNFPDFRAFERGFQILTQVSGRAGRRLKQGKVVIQTYNPHHPILKYIIDGNYLALFQSEIYEREKFNYPPFTRLIKISCKNSDLGVLRNVVIELGTRLRESLSVMVLGPEEALIPRIRNLYIQEFLIKLPRNTISPSSVKIKIQEIIKNLVSKKNFKSTRYQIDIDPI